jgi:hypothetical protein
MGSTLTTRQITIAMILATAFILIVWDIWAYVTVGGEATISAVILDNSKKYPMLPFSFGVLIGHLMWPQKVKEGEK